MRPQVFKLVVRRIAPGDDVEQPKTNGSGATPLSLLLPAPREGHAAREVCVVSVLLGAGAAVDNYGFQGKKRRRHAAAHDLPRWPHTEVVTVLLGAEARRWNFALCGTRHTHGD